VTKATTGLQRKVYSPTELDQVLNEVFDTTAREFAYVQRSLRSALDIFKHGGTVTPTFKSRTFRMINDNRRLFDSENSNLEAINTMIDSSPMKDVHQCALNRFISNLPKSRVYHKASQVGNSNIKYRSNLDLAVKSFINGLFTNAYNVKTNKFRQYSDIVEFVKGYKSTYKISENNIALIKFRSINYKKLPIDSDVLGFVDYVKSKYPNFDSDKFLS
jgi:hypothetical protein